MILAVSNIMKNLFLIMQKAILMNQYTTRKGLIKNPQRFFGANRKPLG